MGTAEALEVLRRAVRVARMGALPPLPVPGNSPRRILKEKKGGSWRG